MKRGAHVTVEMTPEQINEAVAIRLGWEKVPVPGPTPRALWIQKGRYGHGDGQYVVPDYSGDIKLAWEIVEHLRAQQGYALNLKSFTNGVWIKINAGKIEVKADAETAPMALCLAFLKLPS
jgi:hypothetical protein